MAESQINTSDDEALFHKALEAAGNADAPQDNVRECLREVRDEFERHWRDGFIAGYQIALSGKTYEPVDD